MQEEEGEELATFGAGCYWGTEKFFVVNFQKQFPDSLLGWSVGFMSPEASAKENPKYSEVRKGNTTHIEVFQIRFNNKKCKYEDLVRFFFSFHDPTQVDAQDNDEGT